jgi:hypothetical protein
MPPLRLEWCAGAGFADGVFSSSAVLNAQVPSFHPFRNVKCATRGKSSQLAD